MVTVVFQRVGEADVSRSVDQNMVTPGADDVGGTDNASQNAVLMTDTLRRQTGNTVSGFMPVDDRLKILLTGIEITIGRMSGFGIRVMVAS